MTKQEYMTEVGEPVRRLAIAALVAASIVCTGCFLAITALTILRFRSAPIGSLLGTIFLFGGLAFTTGWLAVRLTKRVRAANGRTDIPERFIQIFGILFLIGLVYTAILYRNIWIVGEAVGVAFAMITIRSTIRQQQGVE